MEGVRALGLWGSQGSGSAALGIVSTHKAVIRHIQNASSPSAAVYPNL